VAVLIEATSVVVREADIVGRVPGGWETYEAIAPNQTLCADSELARIGLMSPQDVEAFIKKLETFGLTFLLEGKSVDIAVVDQIRGPTTECDWLKFGKCEIAPGQRVAACRLVRSQVPDFITPPGWKFAGSLSSTFTFVPGDGPGPGMKFLRHENNVDVYLDLLTGKEAFVGRTGA
jgi:hypothetical protein